MTDLYILNDSLIIVAIIDNTSQILRPQLQIENIKLIMPVVYCQLLLLIIYI